MNGVSVPSLQGSFYSLSSWVDITSYFQSNTDNIVKFKAEDTCPTNRYFDMNWDVMKDNTPPTITIVKKMYSSGADVITTFYKQDTYTLQVQYEDLESGLQSCSYEVVAWKPSSGTYETSISGSVQCGTTDINLKIGADEDLNHCYAEYDQNNFGCRIYFNSTNNVGLTHTEIKYFLIDWTKPQAH